jgi:hypothetical protein
MKEKIASMKEKIALLNGKKLSVSSQFIDLKIMKTVTVLNLRKYFADKS